jgi:hypothetical protein
MTANQLVPAAQYLRMSTEHQQYSLENQSTAIQRYADSQGFEVVRQSHAAFDAYAGTTTRLGRDTVNLESLASAHIFVAENMRSIRFCSQIDFY